MTPPIDSLRLENFRGFKSAEIELRPLTVLIGPNSAGKSSFGQSLAALAHAHWLHSGGGLQATLTPTQRELDDWPVDLGTFEDLRTTGSEGPVVIGLRVGGRWLRLGFGDTPGLRDLRLSEVEHPVFSDLSRSGNVEVINAPDTTPVANIDSLPISEVLAPLTENARLRRVNEIQWMQEGRDVSLSFDGVIPKVAQHLPGGTAVPLDTAFGTSVSKALLSFAYLRGARERPLRRYRDGRASRQQMGYAGEYAAAILAERAKENVANSRDGLEQTEPLDEALSYWFRHLGLAFAAIAKRLPGSNEVSLSVALDPNATSRDLPDLGFGVSQVLPVLMCGLLQPKNSLFVVDLPEAHLHPRPQAPLADFFCALALTGRSSIVETHSDLFFHQLRLRVAREPMLREMIRVYFVDQPPGTNECAQPRVIELDAHGQLQWPKGFMHEGWELENEILRARRRS